MEAALILATALSAIGWGLAWFHWYWYKRAMRGWRRALELWGEGNERWYQISLDYATAVELHEAIDELHGEVTHRIEEESP